MNKTKKAAGSEDSAAAQKIESTAENLSNRGDERKLHLSVMQDHRDNGKAIVTRYLHKPWSEVRGTLFEPRESTDKAARGMYKFALFRPRDDALKGYRDTEHFVAASALTLDFDKNCTDGDIEKLASAYAAYQGIVHTTHSDQPGGARRLRAVLPLNRDVDAEELNALARVMIAKADPSFSKVDTAASTSASQGMYVPCRPPGGSWEYVDLVGAPVDVDAELAVLGPNWRTDRSRWPRPAGDGVPTGGTARDPREAPGWIGAFNRAFDIDAAIDGWALPYERAGERYRHIGSEGQPAASLKFDGYALLSMHMNHDPAAGHVCGAFDLVRIHKFGELDRDCVRDTAMRERPSYRKMLEIARSRPEVQREYEAAEEERHAALAAEFDNLGDGPAADAPKKLKDRSRFRPVPWLESLNRPAPQWRIHKVIPQHGLVVVIGAPGSSKTFFLLDMCVAIARGTEWRGRKVTRSRVAYVLGEGADDFEERKRAYAKHHDLLGVAIDVHTIYTAANLIEAQEVAELIAELSACGGFHVVVIDTFARATPGANENSSEDMGKAIAACQRIADAVDGVVILVHHCGKDAARGARGWSGILGAADCEIEVTRNGSQGVAEVKKLRSGPDGERFGYDLVPVPLEPDENGEERSSLVVVHMDSPAASGKKARLTGVNQKAVFETLQEFQRAGRDVVSEREVLDAATVKLRRGPKTGRARDNSRRDTVRALDTLKRKGWVFAAGDDQVSLRRPVLEGTAAEFDAVEDDPSSLEDVPPAMPPHMPTLEAPSDIYPSGSVRVEPQRPTALKVECQSRKTAREVRVG